MIRRMNYRMDQCSEWYTRKRSRLIVFWVVANLFLVAVAYSLNWKFAVEKLLLRRVDDAAPR